MRFPTFFGDVDFCLKLRARGLRIVLTPHAQVELVEAAPPGFTDAERRQAEIRALRNKWGEALGADPYYSPILSLDGTPFSALGWPPRARRRAPTFLPWRPTFRLDFDVMGGQPRRPRQRDPRSRSAEGRRASGQRRSRRQFPRRSGSMNILFVHNNFPAQFSHLAQSLALRPDCRVAAIGSRTARGIANVDLRRYAMTAADVSSTHPFARRFDVECRRAEQVLYALSSLSASGFVPDLIIAHPGWAKTLPLRAIYPKARIVLYCEFFYSARIRTSGRSRVRGQPAPMATSACT